MNVRILKNIRRRADWEYLKVTQNLDFGGINF